MRKAFRNWRIAGRDPGGESSGYVLVRVSTNDGVVGWGEAGRFCEAETPFGIVWTIEHLLAPRLVGADPLNRLAIHRRMDRAIAGNPHAKGAIDMALFDVAGKALGVPACMLLGGQLRDSVAVSARVGSAESIDDACRRAGDAAAEGYRCVKLKVGEDVARDIQTVRQVRATVGPDFLIRLDANQGYSRAAVPAIQRMEASGLLVIEQPFPADDLATMQHLATTIDTPVMADEAATSPRAVVTLAAWRAADAIQVKVGRAAGLGNAYGMAMAAEALGLSVGIGSMLEAGVGAAAVLQLAAAVPALPFPLETSGPLTFAETDIVQTPIAVRDGRVNIPSGPGLGIEVDEAALQRLRLQL